MSESEEQLKALWKQYKRTGSQSLRNELVRQYLPLAKAAAERLWLRLPQGIALEELQSAGILGLVGAIESFDPSRNVKFETFCLLRIRGAILDELRARDWVPRRVRTNANKLEAATKTLVGKLGRQPTEEELARELGVSLSELTELMHAHAMLGNMTSGKSWQDSDGDKVIYEIENTSDHRQQPPPFNLQREDIKKLIVKGLSEKERLIILLYYYDGLTMKEIGSILNLSESRVSQMHAAILVRLRHTLAQRRLEFTK